VSFAKPELEIVVLEPLILLTTELIAPEVEANVKLASELL